MGQRQSKSPSPPPPPEPSAYRVMSDLLYKQRNSAFAASQDAYRRGDHATAKMKSEEARHLDQQAAEKGKLAGDAIFEENNQGRTHDEIDLHGLYVAEALAKVEEVVREARKPGSEVKAITFIVGRGLHSPDGEAKIKPAVMELIQKYSLRVTEGRPNAGCLYVEMVDEANKGFLGLISDSCTIS